MESFGVNGKAVHSCAVMEVEVINPQLSVERPGLGALPRCNLERRW